MKRLFRPSVAFLILFSGVALISVIGLASERFGWQLFSNAYIYQVADLSVTLSDSPDPAAVGGRLIYEIAVTNAGPDVATGVLITDALPESVVLDSASSSQGTCTGTTTVTCDLGPLPSGSSAKVTIVVAPTMPGTITNTVYVVGNENDPDTVNNTATEDTDVECRLLMPLAVQD